MDEILHTPREESSAIRPPLAQLRDRWEAGTAALAQRVEPLRRRLDAATADYDADLATIWKEIAQPEEATAYWSDFGSFDSFMCAELV